MLRPDLVETVALDDGEPVVIEEAGRDRLRHHRDVWLRRHLIAERCKGCRAARAVRIEAGIAKAAAENAVLVDEQHLGAGARRAKRRRDARRPAAHHRHVAPAVGLVVIAVVGRLVHPPEPRAAADDRLPERPCALRPEEALVVEADGQEFSECADDGAAVILQAAVDVLRFDFEPLADRIEVGLHVRLIGKLHQGVGVLAGHGEHAARAAVFEGARQDPLAVRGERACDRVAGEAGEGLAFEAEGDRLRTVDPFARCRWQPVRLRAHASPFSGSGAA